MAGPSARHAPTVIEQARETPGAWSSTTTAAQNVLNVSVAEKLDEVAALLEEQKANPFRVQAYRNAAATVRRSTRGMDDILDREGLAGLDRLPGIGPALARLIEQLVLTGRMPMLERLRGESDPIAVLASVPGIGATLAARLHDELDIETLEQLETAAHDGTLERVAGFGEKRVAGIRDILATRLGRARLSSLQHVGRSAEPTVEDLLDVDREYREAAAAGTLTRIAPRRFNPAHESWLPVLHASRGSRHFTALFSNTARAHQLGKIRDWVVLYFDGQGGEGQHTVVTATSGPLAGRRVVRGREAECVAFYEGRRD